MHANESIGKKLNLTAFGWGTLAIFGYKQIGYKQFYKK